jgi:N-acetylglucosaminyl-diphospho-decaprenol L-rhamnosyltransferase
VPCARLFLPNSTNVSVKLAIVIVNWNGGELLHRCLASVDQSPPNLAYEIVVVDNASTDGSREWLESLRNRIRLIKNETNLGFGRAANQALTLTNAEIVLLINPDAEVPPGAIDTLIATLLSDNRIGACGPRILNADGSVQVSVWHNPARAWQILLSQMRLYLLLPQPLRGELLLGWHWKHDRKRTVPMLSGAAIMARREMIEEVGGFDERFHMYGEDNEWCWRVTRAGWQLVFEPAVTIVHHGGQSVQQRWTDAERLRIQLDAEYSFQEQVLPRWRLVVNQLANYFVDSVQKGWRRIRGIHHPRIELKTRIHGEQLRRSLGIGPAKTRTPRPKSESDLRPIK